MERTTALRLARKLTALADPTRGGTPAERALADAKAKRLIERHGLRGHELRERTRERRPFTAPSSGPAERWSFDPTTGQASANVKVHSYRDRTNWRIEIPYDALYGQRRQVGDNQEGVRRERTKRLDSR